MMSKRMDVSLSEMIVVLNKIGWQEHEDSDSDDETVAEVTHVAARHSIQACRSISSSWVSVMYMTLPWICVHAKFS